MFNRLLGRVAAAVFLAPAIAAAQVSEIIDTAGDGAGNSLFTPRFVAVDSSGSAYVTGALSDNAFAIDPSGVITEIIDSSGDGAGNGLNDANGVAVDSFGNVYVAGRTSNNVFKITPAGVVTEILDVSGDGAGNALLQAFGVAVDRFDNVYIAGFGSNNAFKITPSGVVTEIIDGSGDGAGNVLSGPRCIAVDGSDNVYVMGAFSDNAFKITPAGTITEIIDGSGDGLGNALIDPFCIAADAAGNAYVSGFSNAFRITPGGVITQIIDASGDGTNALTAAVGIAVDSDGNVFVSGGGTDNVFEITPGGVITEVIDASGDGAGNTLDGPNGIAVDVFDRLYVTGASSNNAFQGRRSAADRVFEDTGSGINNVTGAPSGWTADVAGVWTVGGTVADIAALAPYAGSQAAADMLAALGAGNQVIAATVTSGQESVLSLPTLAATTPGGLSFDFPFEQAVFDAFDASSTTLIFDNFQIEFDDAPGGVELFLSMDTHVIKEVDGAGQVAAFQGVGVGEELSSSHVVSKPGPDGVLGTADDVPFSELEQTLNVSAPTVVFIETGRVRATAFFAFDGTTPSPTDLPGARSVASLEPTGPVAPNVPALGDSGQLALATALGLTAWWFARRRQGGASSPDAGPLGRPGHGLSPRQGTARGGR